ncbi:uncharacterized protein LOC131033457 isoform X2 [Cryptomeria japonica]|uniref:uncharacterized protein LOC131033457 isoform X2 n=1 Tax=Cryptomeria japonica TaxID=3369 RepID=UPI0027DA4C2D|nr:uncharacterized protein LOC131033457 isoform X2 [Cryptomeria japonica]
MSNTANRKGLSILMRMRMRPANEMVANVSPSSNPSSEEEQAEKQPDGFDAASNEHPSRILENVQKLMHGAIHIKKMDTLDLTLTEFSQGYLRLGHENRRKALLALAIEYGVNRVHVRDLIQHYLGLQSDDHRQTPDLDEEGLASALYRTERNLRCALKPLYTILFERLNAHPGGLKFLVDLRVDISVTIEEERVPSLRALDSELKERLATWLSPAVLELYHITWNDPASLLEKIVAYEAVHPISNLYDLKRRLGTGHRCFGYLHPAIPGEPLIFIEVALMKSLAQSIQEVLWDEPPIPEIDATTALFYSISSTQPGLAGINLGKFLIKRVIELVRQEMPHIKVFATLSPIPGFMQWLLSKLAQSTSENSTDLGEASTSTFKENLLLPEEEKAIVEAFVYLLKEKKRGKALDPVTNFHVQNGATLERLNWMADRSQKGLSQSAGIMVNYLYRVDEIEENAQKYFDTGYIGASAFIEVHLKSSP